MYSALHRSGGYSPFGIDHYMISPGNIWIASRGSKYRLSAECVYPTVASALSISSLWVVKYTKMTPLSIICILSLQAIYIRKIRIGVIQKLILNHFTPGYDILCFICLLSLLCKLKNYVWNILSLDYQCVEIEFVLNGSRDISVHGSAAPPLLPIHTCIRSKVYHAHVLLTVSSVLAHENIKRHARFPTLFFRLAHEAKRYDKTKQSRDNMNGKHFTLKLL